MNKTKDLVSIEGNVITIRSLAEVAVLDKFIKIIKKDKKEEFEVRLEEIEAVYPNVSVPIAGIVEYYRVNDRIKFKSDVFENKLQSILSPYELPQNEKKLKRALGKIWKFKSSEEVCQIQAAIIAELRRQEIFANGILEGIEWSINEIMDNVLNHAHTTCGFIMGQIHKNSKHVAFTIYDAGIGIYNSLKNSKYAPKSEDKALEICLHEGVTRDEKIGQGNGMNGLFSLIKEGKGSLTISSGKKSYQYINNRGEILKCVHSVPSPQNRTTTIDFQLDYSKNISIEKVLTFNGHVFDLTDLYVENLTNKKNELVFKIAKIAEGTGTRESAQRLKNEIINSMKTNNQIALLDFEGVNVVTSSFIDELIAKLLIDLGLFQFNKMIKLSHMTKLIQQTLQKSVIQRIFEEYK